MIQCLIGIEIDKTPVSNSDEKFLMELNIMLDELEKFIQEGGSAEDFLKHLKEEEEKCSNCDSNPESKESE